MSKNKIKRGPGDSRKERDIPFSRIGRKLTEPSGILELMEDLGKAMTIRPDILMLGGGNPACIPELQRLWKREMRKLLASGGRFDRALSNYDPPQGNPIFIKAFAGLLRKAYGWPVTPDNIAITNGTQTSFFFLFNLLAGRHQGKTTKKILIPLCPEYLGYADQGLERGLFVSCRSIITWPAGGNKRCLKYEVDFEAVEKRLRKGDIAAMAISRPTNPTGNMISDAHLRKLSDLAARHNVLLIIDNAYGLPFPGIVFSDESLLWAPHIINTFSLSKLGLPGLRTGIVTGPEKIISAVQSMTAIAGLANGTLGQQLVLPLVESGGLLELGPRVFQPFYLKRSLAIRKELEKNLADTGVDWAMHVNEGAFFIWLWLRNLPITTGMLHRRLKERNVLVVPGRYFFYGLPAPWKHADECLRITFSQPMDKVAEGVRRIAEEIRLVMSEKSRV